MMSLPEPLDRISAKLRQEGGEKAIAAVAVVFLEEDDGLKLLLVKRAVVLGDPWSGDMAFPGGKRHPGDETIHDTVVREVSEETSIDLTAGRFLGMMEEVLSNARPGMRVLPMIFLLDEVPEIRINEELSKYVWTKFSDLPSSRGRTIVKNRFDTPVFHVGDDVVWGLTYRMVENLLALVEES